MRYRALGHSGLSVSEIGFGAWGIGGSIEGDLSYGATSDTQSQGALERALEAGVSFFDTAPAYGNGHSEELIGKVLKRHRSGVAIATKGGIERFETAPDFSSAALTEGLEGSLRRLNTDYVDLYQLHNPPPDLIHEPERLQELFASWASAGKIRALGISVKSPEEALLAIDRFELATVQVNFNLIDQRCLETGLFATAMARGVSIIARTPLCFGFLTGLYSSDTDFPPGDHRNRWPAKQIDLWAGALDNFRDVISRHGANSPAQFALRYCLSYDAVATTIPGMLNVEHVNDNCGASDSGPLPDSDRAVLEEIYQSNSFFAGAA